MSPVCATEKLGRLVTAKMNVELEKKNKELSNNDISLDWNGMKL